MDNKIKYKAAWSLANKSDEFKNSCVEHDFDEVEQQYIVCRGMDHELNDREICELIGIEYNHSTHKHIKSNRDEDRHDELIFITVRCLQNVTTSPTGKKLTTLEHLDIMIDGDLRATDKIKAMELRQKLEDKAQGSTTLKPWELLWINVIIPNMLVPQ